MSWFDENILRPETAGVAGALLGLFNAPGADLRERAFNLLAGVGAATFLGPWITDLIGVHSKNSSMALAFTVGLVGMNLVSKLIDQARTMTFADFVGMLRRAPSPPPPPPPRSDPP